MGEQRVHDGGKFGSFDGFVLEVSGLSGSAKSRRLAVEAIDAIGIVEAGGELMLGVKSRKGGFGLVISAARQGEWQSLVDAVVAAKAAAAP